MIIREDEGITGVTFDSDGNQLVGVLYLARGQAPKPTVLLLHGCPGLEKNLDIAIAQRDGNVEVLLKAGAALAATTCAQSRKTCARPLIICRRRAIQASTRIG